MRNGTYDFALDAHLLRGPADIDVVETAIFKVLDELYENGTLIVDPRAAYATTPERNYQTDKIIMFYLQDATKDTGQVSVQVQ